MYYTTFWLKNQEYIKKTDACIVGISAGSINSAKIVFKDLNGNVLSKQDVVYGQSATAPKAPETLPVPKIHNFHSEPATVSSTW